MTTGRKNLKKVELKNVAQILNIVLGDSCYIDVSIEEDAIASIDITSKRAGRSIRIKKGDWGNLTVLTPEPRKAKVFSVRVSEKGFHRMFHFADEAFATKFAAALKREDNKVAVSSREVELEDHDMLVKELGAECVRDLFNSNVEAGLMSAASNEVGPLIEDEIPF